MKNPNPNPNPHLRVERATSPLQRATRPLLFLSAFVFSVFFAVNSPAQILVFGTGQTITGTTNAPASDTNTAVVSIRPDQFTIQMPGALICTGAVANIYLSLNPTNTTNALLVASWQGSLFNNTNVSTGSRYTTNTPVYTLLQIQLGTNAPTVQNIYGP